jgi:threonyl-tRNA synthetase
MTIRVRLPDGRVQEYPDGTSAGAVARDHAAPTCIAARVNGEVRDLNRALPAGEVALGFIHEYEPDGWEVLRHSASHIMAGAVRRLIPGTKVAIGPAIQDGFYYDLDPPRTITDEDLAAVEREMARIVEQDFPFERIEVPRAEALRMMKEAGEPFKVELIEELENGPISFYRDGEYLDLCTGPHIPSTGRLKAFKLTRSTGAYWRGDAKNKMLQRVYGTAFHSAEALAEFLRREEEAKRRDHRKLGVQLDLFSVHPDEVGGGLIHWHPNGAIVRRQIEEFSYALHQKYEYQYVYTPHLTGEELYAASGHLESFAESMFGPMEAEGRKFRIKPMNCPHHIMIYKSRLHSYRELPVRYAELGTVYRYEASGVLHGLLRVRGFTQDDAHIFVAPDQLADEIGRVYAMMMEFLAPFKFSEHVITLSTRPAKAVGEPAEWERAETALRAVLQERNVAAELDAGGGAFYGPKISLEVKDCLGRRWQCSTIQLDFNLPRRFGLEFIDRDGRRGMPQIIHRALTGSLERFVGVLVEHTGGDFPLWLAPIQAAVLTLTKQENEYGRQVRDRLRAAGLRARLDDSTERIGAKVRDWTLQKVPYLLVVGKREAASGQVSVRERGKPDRGAMPLEALLEEMRMILERKS